MPLIAIVGTLLFDFNSIQQDLSNFIMNSILVQSIMLIVSVLSCLIVCLLRHHSNKEYEEFIKNIPEYIYKTEYYSNEPLSDKSEKIKISDITEKCYINGYGFYDPNNP